MSRAVRVGWASHDHYRLVTFTALAGLSAAAFLSAWGLPPVDLHGPLHRVGIMDPLCGGTRAAFFTVNGEWGRAWEYNPLGIVAVGAALLGAVRTVVGVLSRRWLTVSVTWTPRRRRWALVLGVGLLTVLEVRQQLRAPMLMAGTYVWT